jgi:hypothetical protein
MRVAAVGVIALWLSVATSTVMAAESPGEDYPLPSIGRIDRRRACSSDRRASAIR